MTGTPAGVGPVQPGDRIDGSDRRTGPCTATDRRGAVIRFFGYFRSSAAYRCRIALNLKGIDYEFVSVHLRRGGGEQHLEDYRQLNPQGLVPVLEQGDFRLSQSLAIIEWLDETQPEPALLPREC
jgi:maleylacetoacetate isomerase